jgi:hypothetical protein
MAITGDEQLNSTEACQVLRQAGSPISPDRLLRRLRGGEIEGAQIAGRWVTTRQALERYLAGQRGEQR